MATKINEAFISELLAEVLKLETAIDNLPARIEQSAESFVRSTEALERAGQGFKDHIDKYMRDQQEVLANNINLLAQNAIRSTAEIQRDLINKAVINALEQYENNRVDKTRDYVIVAAIAVSVSVLLTVLGFVMFLDNFLHAL